MSQNDWEVTVGSVQVRLGWLILTMFFGASEQNGSNLLLSISRTVEFQKVSYSGVRGSAPGAPKDGSVTKWPSCQRNGKMTKNQQKVSSLTTVGRIWPCDSPLEAPGRLSNAL